MTYVGYFEILGTVQMRRCSLFFRMGCEHLFIYSYIYIQNSIIVIEIDYKERNLILQFLKLFCKSQKHCRHQSVNITDISFRHVEENDRYTLMSNSFYICPHV